MVYITEVDDYERCVFVEFVARENETGRLDFDLKLYRPPLGHLLQEVSLPLGLPGTPPAAKHIMQTTCLEFSLALVLCDKLS
eukprot:1377934-Amorphochlora_amoeboformis.AAC.1